MASSESLIKRFGVLKMRFVPGRKTIGAKEHGFLKKHF
jgi:hypothetical protein